MKILLSSSTKHFDTKTRTVRIRHSVGVLVELFTKAIEDLGEIKYISDTDHVEGEEFDLIISWPRNFYYLTRNNKYKKSVCFFNIAQSDYLKRVMSEEAGRLGCKLSDCFTPQAYYDADLNFLIGNETVIKQYTDVGIDRNKIVNVRYRHGYIPWKTREKNQIPTFIHIGTSLGLRKGFWHVVEDFKNSKIDGKLICVGKIQNERFWIDYAREANEHPNIEVVGWVDNHTQQYIDIIHSADFVVFPSFGEGQPGTVIEAMEGGCLPLLTKESGIDFYPLGVYERGNTDIWKRAANMNPGDFAVQQQIMRKIVYDGYDNQKFINTVRSEIEKLMGVRE